MAISNGRVVVNLDRSRTEIKVGDRFMQRGVYGSNLNGTEVEVVSIENNGGDAWNVPVSYRSNGRVWTERAADIAVWINRKTDTYAGPAWDRI
jgi:hypothetical protein